MTYWPPRVKPSDISISYENDCGIFAYERAKTYEKATKETKLLTTVEPLGNRIWGNSDNRKKCKESGMIHFLTSFI